MNRNEERMGRLEESMAALADAQRHTDEQIRALTEAQHRTEEQVTALVQAQRSTQESIQQLARTVGALSDNIGFSLEDIARVVLPGYLQRHFGIVLNDAMDDRSVGWSLEFDADLAAYSKGRICGRACHISSW